jgi:hypothetical protein
MAFCEALFLLTMPYRCKACANIGGFFKMTSEKIKKNN